MNRNRYAAEDAESSNDTQAGSSSLVEEEEETEEGWTQGEIVAKIKTSTLYISCHRIAFGLLSRNQYQCSPNC